MPETGSHQCSDTEQKRTEFLVVHGKSVVEQLSASGSGRDSVIATIQAKFGPDVEKAKTINFSNGDSGHSCYRFPIIAICSKSRHGPAYPGISQSESDFSATSQRRSILDLHTSEAPIETTDLELTIDQLQLRDLSVGGILDIYAVERSEWAESCASGTGKEAVFGLAESWVRHLRHPSLS